jgi:hypothetical protein
MIRLTQYFADEGSGRERCYVKVSGISKRLPRFTLDFSSLIYITENMKIPSALRGATLRTSTRTTAQRHN